MFRPKPVSIGLLVGSLGLALAVACAPRSDEQGALRHITVPEDGQCPDAALDGNRLHLVYGRKDAVYYAASTDGGRTFSRPVRVSDSSSTALVYRERGPRIALGRDGAIHVAWLGSGGEHVFYSRSLDRGRSFSAPRNLLPPGSGADEATLAGDTSGRVYILWLGGGAGSESPVSSLIQVASSSDNGNTFSTARTAHSNYPGGACACCSLRATTAPNGDLLVVFRGAYRSVRDIYLLRGAPSAQHFEATRVSQDNWVLDICPMVGPWVQTTADPKQVFVAWMSAGQVYNATSGDGGLSFSPRTPPAERQRSARVFPLVLANARGERLFAWVESQSVRWERIATDGQVAASGESGRQPSNSKFTAFVDRDGNFALVY